MVDVLSSESCLLTLNYAWFHVINCSFLILAMYFSSSRKHLKTAHNFGIFAMLADYGLMYLTKGTRTISVVREEGATDVDDLYVGRASREIENEERSDSHCFVASLLTLL